MSTHDSDLVSPLLYAAPSKDGYSSAHEHVVTPDSTALGMGTEAKFGEYVSRAKARAQNTMTICAVPFNLWMLICIMFLTFGSYWCYDIPGSIETSLTAWFGNSYTHSSNLLFYSIYSWPNCILAFFGGFILDKITGVRRGAILFCGLVTLGQLIFSLGVQWKIYYLALFGRFVFGLGGENLTVAQNTYTVRWFDGKRLALAFGLVVAFSRIGTSVNFVVSPILANSPIQYKETFYSDSLCGNQLTEGDISSLDGPINKCSDYRIVQCDSLKNDFLPALHVFNSADWNCTTTPRFVQDIPNGACFNTSEATESIIITMDSLTNNFKLEVFDLGKCEGKAKYTVNDQGNSCHDANLYPALQKFNWRIVADTDAPCNVQQYGTVDCSGENQLLNKWGMTTDTCTVTADPDNVFYGSYKFIIDPGTGVPKTLWFGMGMCGMSFIACLLASYFDWWGESKVESDRQVIMATLSEDEQAYVKKLDDMNEPTSDDVSFAMVRRIPGSAWLLFVITAVFYVAILNFYQVASDLMQNTGNFISDDTAGLYLAIPNFVAIVGSPLGGYTVDKFGRALVFIAVACGMLICAHVFFLALAYGWVTMSPVPAMIWLGCTYSLGASCLWPILAFIVEKEALGTAYGCMTSVQNLFLAVAALLIGQLQDWAKSSHPGVLQYTLPIIIFIACATIALVCTILLIAYDRKQNDGKLNASAEERHARMLREEAEQEVKNQATRVDSTGMTAAQRIENQTNSNNEENDGTPVASSPSKSLNANKQFQ